MSSNPLVRALALVLVFSLLAPTAVLIVPQETHAAKYVGCLTGLAGGAAGGVVGAAISVPVNSAVANVTNSLSLGTTFGSCINDFIIKPLIQAAIRALLQKITGKIIAKINGSNSTGRPFYVRDLLGYNQKVGDAVAMAFFDQVDEYSDSPFTSSISSSLRLSYLEHTSSRGFFTANRNTLGRYSGDVNRYLSGGQGNAAAWFALTTQPQNNPYMLYQASQRQLDSLTTGAQTAKKQELGWGNGFISWCAGEKSDELAPVHVSCRTDSGAKGFIDETTHLCVANANSNVPGGVCTMKDGNPGKIQTPGAIIHKYTEKAVVDSGMDQFIKADDLDAAFGAILTAMANKVLSDVGGLLGASVHTSSDGGRTLVDDLNTYSDNNSSSEASTATDNGILSDAVSAQQYQSAWGTIRSTASSAASALTKVVNSCGAAALSARPPFGMRYSDQVTAAQNALTRDVNPLIAQADAAIKSQTKPTLEDTTFAQQNAQSNGAAIDSPSGSLTVSGGTIIDRMALLNTNAARVKQDVCDN